MTQDVQAIREDLAFMRALASEGRRAPLLIGQSLVGAGLVFGGASLFAGAVSMRWLPLPRWWEAAIWFAAVAVYLPYVRFRRRQCEGARPGSLASNNRAVGAAWRGIGWAILSLFAAALGAANVTGDAAVFDLFPSVVMAIYGAGWVVASVMSDQRWLRWVAAGCFAAAVVLGFTASSVLIWFVYAASMFALASVPGWVLTRSEPSLEV